LAACSADNFFIPRSPDHYVVTASHHLMQLVRAVHLGLHCQKSMQLCDDMGLLLLTHVL
jgi:hypothetical protein